MFVINETRNGNNAGRLIYKTRELAEAVARLLNERAERIQSTDCYSVETLT